MRISWRFRWFLFGVQTLLGSFCLGTREIGIKGFLFPWSHQENRYHMEPKVFSLMPRHIGTPALELCLFRRWLVTGDGPMTHAITPTAIRHGLVYPACDEFVDASGLLFHRLLKFERHLKFREKVLTHKRRLELELPTDDPRIGYKERLKRSKRRRKVMVPSSSGYGGLSDGEVSESDFGFPVDDI